MFLKRSTVQPIDERLKSIEERIAWLERHVVAQDKAMLELSEANERLKRELLVLRTRVASEPAGPNDAIDGLADRPPHY